jgi:hypothetical protein
MKSLYRTGAVMICILAGFAFSSAANNTEDCYDSKLVRSWVELQPSVPEGNTFLEKAIYRSGDRIALGIVHTFTTEELLDPGRLNRVISIVRLSFSQPKYITRNQDKHPAVTKLLRSFWEYQCKDAKLRKNITDAEEYISMQADAGSPIR